MSPNPKVLPILNHEADFIMNQTFQDHKAYEWKRSYAYSSIMGRFLHL